MEHCGCWRCMDKPCPKCEELVKALQAAAKVMEDYWHDVGDAPWDAIQLALRNHEATK